MIKIVKIVENVSNAFIDLGNAVNKSEIPKNENPDEAIDNVEEILKFDKQQRGKWIKVLTSKQMLQRLEIALAQIKACNTS